VKILYFIDSLVPSGAEKSLLALSPHYLAGGVELEIAYLNDRPGLQEEFSSIGVPTVCLDGPGGRLGWARRAQRLASERKPDLIHTTLFEADLAGRTAAYVTRTPVVSSLVNAMYGPEQFGDPNLSAAKLRMAQAADAATARVVTRWHSISEHVADIMAHRLLIDRDRIDIVPRGRDPEALGVRSPERRARVRASLGITNDVPMLISAARQEFQKGLTTAIEAFARLLTTFPDAVFVIAGREGNASQELHAISARLGVERSLRFIGARDDVPDLMAAADVCVISSLWEGLGGTAIEAMGLAVPLVASDLPPIREVVGDGVARLVPKGEAEPLARALTDILEDRDEAAVGAERGHERFLENFAIQSVAQRMLEFYDRAGRTAPRKTVAKPATGQDAHPLKLLYVIDSLVPGGAERSLASLAPHYLKLGIDLTVGYLGDRPGLQDELRDAGVKLVNLDGPGGRPGNVYRVGHFVREWHPDLVHTTLFEADLAGRMGSLLAHVPVVSTLPAEMYDWEHVHDPTLSPWRVRAAQIADMTTAQSVRAFHAVSSHVAEVMAQRLHVPPSDIRVIPRGRDPQVLGERTPERRAEVRARIGAKPDDLILFAAARHEHKKALDVLLEAFSLVHAEFPKTRLVIAGREGIQTPLLTDTVEKLDIHDHVDFLGTRDDVPDLLCAADVFVLSSVSEGFPGSVLEALAMETPIVATDLPGVREILGDEKPCGKLVPTRRHDLLAAAVIETLRDPVEAERVAGVGRERFLDMFSIERVAERMVEFYRSSLESA
jgi:glycosyltransferase involved in cell wall biosynthesis